MKHVIASILFAAFFVSCSPGHKAENSVLFPYWDKSGGFLAKFKHKAGYMDLKGNKVIESKYVYAEPFTEGLGCVGIATDSGVFFGYIDSAANYVIKPGFANARPFQNNRALVRESYKSHYWGVINRKGEYITDKVFTLATDFCDGYCIAWTKQGTEEASRFEKAMTGIITLGLLPASDHVYYNCYKIDTTGKATLIDAYVENRNQGNYIQARRQNNLGMFWTTDGVKGYGFKKISPEDYELGKMNYFDNGTVFIKQTYAQVDNFQYGYARVKFFNGETGYIDTTGKVVLQFKEDRPY
jgi:hypothetical protein